MDNEEIERNRLEEKRWLERMAQLDKAICLVESVLGDIRVEPENFSLIGALQDVNLRMGYAQVLIARARVQKELNHGQ